MHQGFRDEIVVCAEEGYSIQRAPREVISDFSPELSAEHGVDVVMRGVWQVGLRGHNCLICSIHLRIRMLVGPEYLCLFGQRDVVE